MATDSEDSTSQLKGLSFIDWDVLDRDEFDKLERIIHDSKDSPGVQLPFVQQNAPKLAKCSGTGSVVAVETSVLHPAAPVFQPAIPPPSIVGFPIPVPAWTHQDPTLQASATPYHPHHHHTHHPIPMHGGYVFQDPSGLTVNGEVAFVTTLSNGQPVYAFPGHQMPPNFQQPPPPSHPAHGERVNGNLPQHHAVHATAPCNPHQGGDIVMQPVTVPGGAVMTPSPNHPILVMSPDASAMGPPAPDHVLAPVNASPPSIPHPQATQQMVYPMNPQPTTQTPQADAFMNTSPPVSSLQPQTLEKVTTPPAMAKAISGLPPKQKTPGIEFAGPLVFNTPTTEADSKVSPKDTKKVKKDLSVCLESNVKQPINSNEVVKKTSVKEVVVDVKLNEGTGQFMNHSLPQTVSEPVANNKNKETNPSKNNSPTSMASAKSPDSHRMVNNNVDSNSNSLTTNSSPKMNASPSPLSPSASTPTDATNTKELPSGAAKPSSPPAPKTWSSLFGSKTNSAKPPTTSSAPPQSQASQPIPMSATSGTVPSAPVMKSEPKSISYWQKQEKAVLNSIAPLEKVKSVVAKKDPLAQRLLEKLSNFPISHTPIVIQPRGLKNGRNTCFMNATLQVLMGCPPFINLFRAFKNFPARTGGIGSSTPIFDSLVMFVNSFQNGQRAKQSTRGKKALDLNVGTPFSPDPLLSVAQDILGLNIGVQHDAEEFLSQILSICHEELENIIKMDKNLDSVNNNNDTKQTVDTNGHMDSLNHVQGFVDDDDEDDSWQRVGPKNHSVETNVNDCGQTPLSTIFAGLSRSCLQKESGKSSDTLDSFFTLKLDIQVESVRSVREALLRLNTVEIVHDADGQKVHGQRRMFFDVLPPVLIMHLKLFEYSNGNGQKIQKKISFDVDLQIPKEILSRQGKTKYSSPKARSYKLFGVVNHHGLRMNNGHYTSDVYLPITNGWLHFDDSEVTPTTEAQVLQYCEGSMPYILFYRRMDA